MKSIVLKSIFKIVYIPYTWNYWQVKYLVIRSKNAIGEILIGGFEYCMERNPCLQPKWHTFNIYVIRQTTAKYTMYTVLCIVSSLYASVVYLYKLCLLTGTC